MKLFLAGADMDYHIEPVYLSGHGSMLSSYWKHKDSFIDSWLLWYNKTKHANWIMDSGLFTMMFGAGSDKTYTKKDLLEYTHKYINDMNKINYKGYIVEMDVHKVLGLEELKKFRKIFETKYDIKKTIYVWHIEEKEKGFKKLCKKYPYIAISIPELRIVLNGKKQLEKAVKELVILANKINPNIKIHLLGCTQQNLMEHKGYYSCDSTSWMSSVKYGTGHFFYMNKIKQYSIHTKGWKDLRKNTKLNFTVKHNDYCKNLTLCAKAFRELNRYINNKYYNNEPLNTLL
tara:strand:+ start:153 stop:1016 length:864 start_codon:yes stop_codon:yes gene_type:complete